MTENTIDDSTGVDNEDEQRDREYDEKIWRSGADQQLAFLVGTIEKMNARAGEDGSAMVFPLTLQLNGSIVTGDLVPFARWAEATLAFLSDSESGVAMSMTNPDTGETLIHPVTGEPATNESILRTFFGFDDLDEASTAIAALDDPDRRSIHLLNAKWVMGQVLAPTTSDGAPWRGQLSHVSGWSFGRMS